MSDKNCFEKAKSNGLRMSYGNIDLCKGNNLSLACQHCCYNYFSYIKRHNKNKEAQKFLEEK